MSEPKILLRGSGERSRWRARANTEAVWWGARWLGLAFFVVGGADLALTWVPPHFGNPEWEFGSFTATLNNMPIVVLGIGLALAGGVAEGRLVWIRLAGLLGALLAVLVLVGGLVYATNVPLALRSVTSGAIKVGLLKAVMKTTLQVPVYALVFVGLAVTAWRNRGGLPERAGAAS